MSQPVPSPMSVDEFFRWQEGQDQRFELVAGQPLRMMAGARAVHNTIVINLLAELRDRLRGGPGRPFNGDGSVETFPGQIRRPDAGVDFGRFDPDGLKASEPRLVAEVLSPSTRDLDTLEKLDEYKQIATLSDILLVEPNAPEVTHWRRTAQGGWTRQRIEGLGSEVAMPDLGLAIPLAALYEGVEFPAGPRLLRG